jgi:hypothetical protein
MQQAVPSKIIFPLLQMSLSTATSLQLGATMETDAAIRFVEADAPRCTTATVVARTGHKKSSRSSQRLRSLLSPYHLISLDVEHASWAELLLDFGYTSSSSSSQPASTTTTTTIITDTHNHLPSPKLTRALGARVVVTYLPSLHSSRPDALNLMSTNYEPRRSRLVILEPWNAAISVAAAAAAAVGCPCPSENDPDGRIYDSIVEDESDEYGGKNTRRSLPALCGMLIHGIMSLVPGGNMIVRVNTGLDNPGTQDLMILLVSLFSKVYITRPFAVSPFGIEKYVVCHCLLERPALIAGLASLHLDLIHWYTKLLWSTAHPVQFLDLASRQTEDILHICAQLEEIQGYYSSQRTAYIAQLATTSLSNSALTSSLQELQEKCRALWHIRYKRHKIISSSYTSSAHNRFDPGNALSSSSSSSSASVIIELEEEEEEEEEEAGHNSINRLSRLPISYSISEKVEHPDDER